MDVHESTSPPGYVSILVRQVSQPWVGRRGRVQSRVTFDGKVRNLGPLTFCLRPRQPTVSATTENLAEAPPRSPAPASTGGRSGVGKSSDGRNKHSRIVLPPETGEQPSLLSGLSDAPWLNRRRPGSLYSIIEYE